MQTDKTYMWLAIVTSLALALGLTVGVIHWQEYKDAKDVSTLSGNPFK